MLKSHNKTILEALGRSPIHPFPARMAPGIALDAIGEQKKSIRILDPMAGSGTVLAVARAKGHRAIGFDLDPLSVLLAGVWTRTIDADEARDKAEEVLRRAKIAFSNLPVRVAYPSKSDEETRKFTRYWFDDYSRRQLAALASVISRVRNATIRDALWCGFSRLIITKNAGASLAMDLSHSRPHREFARAPVKPFRRFIAAIDAVVSNCPQKGDDALGPPTIVKQGDARELDIEDGSIDLVLSSPPYLNAIDYMRCSKFSLVWMGHTVEELRAIRGASVGTEVGSDEALELPWVKALMKQLGLRPALSKRNQAILARYVVDIGGALAEVSRVLRRGGRAVYVVGDSTTRGTFVRNSLILASVAEEQGLALVSRQARALPANRRYLPPPKRGVSVEAMDGRLRREVIVVLKKP
jgi:SAM-dependent methyltransferase